MLHRTAQFNSLRAILFSGHIRGEAFYRPKRLVTMPSLPPAIFRPSTTYGSACWARSADVREAGLLAGKGIVLGVRDGRYLRHAGPEHMRPDGLHPDAWPGFSVIHDIKGENWQLTAGWRSQFSNCLLLD